MKTNTKRIKRLKNKELRNKFLADQMKIGLRYQLRSLRDSQGLTQKDLADLIGTKQSVISRLERNAARVSIPTLLEIAEALDVGVVVRFESIDTIIDWYSEPTQKKMTPRKSEDVLTEIENRAALNRKEDRDFLQIGQPEPIDIGKTENEVLYEDKYKSLEQVIHSIKEPNKIELRQQPQEYHIPTQYFTEGYAPN